MPEFLALAFAALALGIASIIALRFKVPPLIVFLLIGMMVGTYGYLQGNTLITFIGDLGSAMLLFSIGTEFSIYKLFKAGFFRESKVAFIEIGFSFLLLFLIFSTKLSTPIAALLALAFTTTSTGISLKLLQEFGLNKKFDIPLIIKISVIEDIITVFAFSIISTFSLSAGQPVLAVIEAFAVSIVLFIIGYYAFTIFINKILFRFNIPEEDLLMLALGVLLLMVSLSGALGLSTSFGAYIAGSIVSTWKDKWRGLENDLKKFSYIFISFFFFSIGIQANLLNTDFVLMLLILPVILIVKFGGVFIGAYEAYRSSRTAFFTSLGMLTRGELSLVIVSAAIAAGLLPASYLGLTALLVFFSVLASFILLRRSSDIYDYFRIRFPRIT